MGAATKTVDIKGNTVFMYEKRVVGIIREYDGQSGQTDKLNGLIFVDKRKHIFASGNVKIWEITRQFSYEQLCKMAEWTTWEQAVELKTLHGIN